MEFNQKWNLAKPKHYENIIIPLLNVLDKRPQRNSLSFRSVVPQKYVKGFSYLYKSMLSDDLFKIEILETLPECAEYLSVDKKLLEDEVK